MSAKGRGSMVIPNEKYMTPIWLIDAMIPYLSIRNESSFEVLEPSCGNGNIVKAIKESHPLTSIDAYDIEYQGCGLQRDFLTLQTDKNYDLVVSNPPFSKAWEFLHKSLSMLKPHGAVVFLLRLGWLGSQKRAKWLRSNTPSIYVTPKRPLFRLNKNGKLGSDSAEYAFFEWSLPDMLGVQPIPKVVILGTERTETK